MRKHLVAVALFLLLPLAAYAQDQRELLLTTDGRLFIAEQRTSTGLADPNVASLTYISLTVRNGDQQQELIVPGTLEAGLHANPALAYDNTSQTLFVFWQRSASLLHSELLFQSLGPDSNWSAVTAFGSVRNMRQNLRIAVTRKSHAPSPDDTMVSTVVPQINVHAVWWESDLFDGVQSARYAMMTIENGVVVDTSIHNLFEFIPEPESIPENLGDLEVSEVFKHPALFVSPQQDGVSVLFGDTRDGSFETVSIQPWKYAGEARVHIPVGRHEGGRIGAPKLVANSNSRVSTVGTPDGRLALYTTEGDSFRYVILGEDGWSEQRELHLDANINTDAAVRAVRRLVEHE